MSELTPLNTDINREIDKNPFAADCVHQQPAHHPNRIGGLGRFHEIEDRFEFTAVS